MNATTAGPSSADGRVDAVSRREQERTPWSRVLLAAVVAVAVVAGVQASRLLRSGVLDDTSAAVAMLLAVMVCVVWPVGLVLCAVVGGAQRIGEVTGAGLSVAAAALLPWLLLDWLAVRDVVVLGVVPLAAAAVHFGARSRRTLPGIVIGVVGLAVGVVALLSLLGTQERLRQELLGPQSGAQALGEVLLATGTARSAAWLGGLLVVAGMVVACTRARGRWVVALHALAAAGYMYSTSPALPLLGRDTLTWLPVGPVFLAMLAVTGGVLAANGGAFLGGALEEWVRAARGAVRTVRPVDERVFRALVCLAVVVLFLALSGQDATVEMIQILQM